jgi:nicotinate phosphoribosyltransferase
VQDLDAPSALDARTDVVAMEQDGAWSPRMGAGFDLAVDPGRKIVVRYFDEIGSPVADIIHLATERIQAAASAVVIGPGGAPLPLPAPAVRSAPLARALLRGGRRVGTAEKLSEARARALSAVSKLPEPLLYLRHPGTYPLGVSAAVAAKKAELLAGHGR